MIPLNQQPLPPSQQTPFLANPPIQGDPGARRFGLIFLGVLAFMTIVGAGVGIGVGNIAHYRYFGPTNSTYLGNYSATNITLKRDLSSEINFRQSSPINEPVQKKKTRRNNRAYWFYINKLQT